MSVHVLFESEAGMSKLKMEEKVALTPAKYWVPKAVVGAAEETGTIRWGYW